MSVKECCCYINSYGTVFVNCKNQSPYQSYILVEQMYEDDINYCPKCGDKLKKEIKEQ